MTFIVPIPGFSAIDFSNNNVSTARVQAFTDINTETKNLPGKDCLEAEGLLCIRDDRILFENLDFRLTGGQVLLLEGHNGSGKTSLLRILCGIRMSDSGSVRWNGEAIEELGADYYRWMIYVGHLDGIKLDLTVLENLEVARSLGQASDLPLSAALVQVDLAGYEDLAGQSLSAGQRRRLALARLLVTVNRLWILDEPFTALDQRGIALFERLMIRHAQNGGMIVLTSHHSVSLEHVEIHRIRLSV